MTCTVGLQADARLMTVRSVRYCDNGVSVFEVLYVCSFIDFLVLSTDKSLADSR